MAGGLSREDIDRYLRLLGERLAVSGRRAEILLAGGAVMVLVLASRETTKDIDAYFSGDVRDVRRIAAEIAEEHGLPPDWLNDGVKGFFYGTPPQLFWAEYPGLRVFTVALDYLLVMKVMAARVEFDFDDARAIIARLGLTRPEEVESLVERYVPTRLLSPHTRYVIQSLFPASGG